MAINEVQKITFSAAPAYGKGTFTGPASESIVVDFSQNLAAEQAAFTAAMATNYPTVARPSGTVHTFTFETGSNAGANVTQMAFTANTTDYALNSGSLALSSFVNSVAGINTITLTEAVTQQGIADVAGVYEVVTFQGSITDILTDTNGNQLETDGSGLYVAHTAAGGWTAGTPGNPMTFTCNSYGPQSTIKAGGAGSVTVDVTGVTPVVGQPEIHTITPTPVSPAGGTCTIGGNSTAYNATPSVTGWTFDTNLSTGVVTATADVNEPRSDTALAPDGSGLTAPPSQYVATFASSVGSNVGWITIDAVRILRSQFDTAGIAINGNNWSFSLSGAALTITADASGALTLTTCTSFLGAAVTGTMSTTVAGEGPSVWYQCQAAVLSALQSLADAGYLPSIASASIVAVEQPQVSRFFGSGGQNAQLSYPGIMVWPYAQETTDIAAGSNLRDEIVYPVAISFIDKNSGTTGTSSMCGSATSRDRHMEWREKVSRKFRHYNSHGITEVRDVYVRPNLYAIPSAYQNDDLYHGAIVVDFFSQETRDNTGG